MNVLTAVFGIFRQRGLVSTIREDQPVSSFVIWGTILSLCGGLLYGLAMGIGLGLETALKDATKVGLIIVLLLLFAVPIFWIAYRLLGREERLSQLLSVPVTLVTAVAIILATMAPIVFLLSVLSGPSANAIYIHIVIVDLALLVGIFLAGTLLYYGFTAHRKLVIPNIVGFLLMAVILVVLINFLGPFLTPSNSYSIGTDRLQDGLGIGVVKKVEQSLSAAADANRLSYNFLETNENGDVTRDYLVTHVSGDALVEIRVHAVGEQTVYQNQLIWLLDGRYFTDFQDGQVQESSADELESILEGIFPAELFQLTTELQNGSWRALEQAGDYTATVVTAENTQATLVLDANTFRLISLKVGSAERALHSELRVDQIESAILNRTDLEASLNRATVIGNVDRSDASLQDYVQDETFFVVRYPRSWQASSWIAIDNRITFEHNCGDSGNCAAFTVAVLELVENKGALQYAQDLARSLNLQPEFRDVHSDTININGQTVGELEYLADRTVKGELETNYQLEYIFVGELYRYHLQFTAAASEQDEWQPLFAELASQFTYLLP